MTTLGQPTDAPAASSGRAPAMEGHRRALVVGSRMALVMLFIAALAMLGLGIAALALVDPPEVESWLRSVFGTVFGYMALGLAAVLGIPAAIGIWAIAGANADDAVPALSRRVSRVMIEIAIATVIAAGVAVLVVGSRVSILDVALVAVVALPSFGLAGAVTFSPHRGRAILAAMALGVVAAGTLWVLIKALMTVPR
jgi:hypothetical protein